MENFEIIKELGKGSFATVYKVKRNSDNQFYAMKRVKVPEMTSSDKEHALNEIRVLASFTHSNIISYKESFYSESSKTLDIVMELAQDGDLISRIKEKRQLSEVFQEKVIWEYLIQMLFGLKCLHDKKFIHRDLKSANVFICKNNNLKIGDFNVTKRLKYTNYLQSQTGTPYYASPEIWHEMPYDMRTDIWSLGCIIYELCTLTVPFKALNINLLSKAACKGVYDPIPSNYSRELSDIIALLLVTDMNKRMNTSQLLANPVIIGKMKKYNMAYLPCTESILETIKMPVKNGDINLVLPKLRRYSSDSNLIQLFLKNNNKDPNLILNNESSGEESKHNEENNEGKRIKNRTKTVNCHSNKISIEKKISMPKMVNIDLSPSKEEKEISNNSKIPVSNLSRNGSGSKIIANAECKKNNNLNRDNSPLAKKNSNNNNNNRVKIPIPKQKVQFTEKISNAKK